MPCLWFDKSAEEAANFYASIFKNSKILNVSKYGDSGSEASGMKKGSVMTVEFELVGQKFLALNGGPIFKFNPSISFFVGCKTEKEVDELWTELSERGKVLMPLEKYPFSEKYGWLQDKYGLSWQIMFVGNREIKQKIVPTLMFIGDVYGKAEEAIKFYASVFKNVKVGDTTLYGKGEKPNKEGTIKHAAFALEDQEFMVMDSNHEHPFKFNESISFMVMCKDQKEIDFIWEKLSAVPESEQCGWLKDKYGLSWQIVSEDLEKMMQDKNPKKTERVMSAVLKMKKIDIKELKKVYEGK